MKGFGIEVKNDLLDPKHVRNMGPAVWLYMWYLDKLTAVNDNGIGKVLGGQPIIFEMVKTELGCSDKTYRRWLETLRDTGYINTLRTPTGLVVTINKAHKVFKKKRSVKSDRSYREPSDRTKTTDPQSDRSQMGEGSVKSADPNKTVLLRNTNDSTQVLTNVNTVSPVFDDGSPDPRNLKVQQVVEHFERKVGHMPRPVYQRRAAQTLVQRHGFEKTIGAINAVAISRGEQYCPVIASLCDLRDRWLELETFYLRKTTVKPKIREIL